MDYEQETVDLREILRRQSEEIYKLRCVLRDVNRYMEIGLMRTNSTEAMTTMRLQLEKEIDDALKNRSCPTYLHDM
jgi:hypothetical protein